MKRILLSAFLIVGLAAGCATKPKAPASINNKGTVSGPVDAVMKRAAQQLVADGFSIKSKDTELGILTTDPKSMSVTTEQADCGAFAGLPYLKDDRTITHVAYSVSLSEAAVGSTRVVVNLNITGTYNPGVMADGSQSELQCVSLGKIEEAFIKNLQ